MQAKMEVGGGSGANGATGTETVSTASELKTINTGLPSISKFMLFMTSTKSGYTNISESVFYDADVPDKYRALASYNGTSGIQGQFALGAANNGCAPIVKAAPTGGTIEIYNASGGNWCVGNWVWVAIA